MSFRIHMMECASIWRCCFASIGIPIVEITQIAKFMGPTWGPPGSCRPQMGPKLAPWTLLSGKTILRPFYLHNGISYTGKTTSLYWVRSFHYTIYPWLMNFVLFWLCILVSTDSCDSCNQFTQIPQGCFDILGQHHDDVIKWQHFPRYWPFVWGIHRSPVNSPHKDQWREALMFCLICARITGWVNNGEAGDLRCHRSHYDVIVMTQQNITSANPVHNFRGVLNVGRYLGFFLISDPLPG